MPELSRFFGIRITMNIGDHPPPHFHAEYGSDEAMVRIDNGAIERGYLRGTRGPDGERVGRVAPRGTGRQLGAGALGTASVAHRAVVMIMKYLNRLKSFTLAGGYRVRVTFRDDYSAEVDLWPLFANPRGPLTEPFRDQPFFQKAFLDEGTLAWPNGFDICSDVLRYYCEQGRVTSKDEMNAYFTQEESAAALHDKPKQ